MTVSNARWKIGFVALTILVLELALIRLLPAEVRSISYFKNLLLIATFSGLGLGCIFSSRHQLDYLLPIGMAGILLFLVVARGIAVYADAAAIHFWLLEAPKEAHPLLTIPVFLAALLTFAFATLPFVSLGQRLVRAMEPHPRLVAYGWDIGGSLLGVLLFTLASYLCLPPWAAIALCLLLWGLWMSPQPLQKMINLILAIAFCGFAWGEKTSHWSPYYLIQTQSSVAGLKVWVNASFHQAALDFLGKDPYAAPTIQQIRRNYEIPYETYRDQHHGAAPAKVLVLGAGTGNDLFIAESNGVQEIVAVEIDPVLVELGRQHHPAHPYENPQLKVVVDDARHYLANSHESFDMIIFATLDSQTLLSGHTNLRLENYVYTAESLQDVRRLLAPDGLFVAYYAVFKPWFYSRIHATVQKVFGAQMRMEVLADNLLFNTIVTGGKEATVLGPDLLRGQSIDTTSLPSTDDWPFIYLQRATIAPIYLELFAVVLLLCGGAFVALRRQHGKAGWFANFFFLGVGFTLVEAVSIVRLSLIFGNTWVVHSMVFSAVLATVFLANLVAIRVVDLPIGRVWTALLLLVATNYFFPIAYLFSVPLPLKVLICALLIGSPVFCASLCFSHLFRQQQQTAYSLGINFIGAMVGANFEYASMISGIRSIWLIVFVVYGLAWLTSRSLKKS